MARRYDVSDEVIYCVGPTYTKDDEFSPRVDSYIIPRSQHAGVLNKLDYIFFSDHAIPCQTSCIIFPITMSSDETISPFTSSTEVVDACLRYRRYKPILQSRLESFTQPSNFRLPPIAITAQFILRRDMTVRDITFQLNIAFAVPQSIAAGGRPLEAVQNTVRAPREQTFFLQQPQSPAQICKNHGIR
ncbi:ADP-L-glycero-D-manno-heptose-6-epimerase [Striga asiatica]|uniref:ADP-L-glycero-D-manno-heptose-6-epimerase n=1 Tax=Striga asiatica TaxID=4170 RepID=A0A5A7REK8_STRAF|nr:ADP-L-glycero-D-manno-heptose-6-epimerase [Striga asiatica]